MKTTTTTFDAERSELQATIAKLQRRNLNLLNCSTSTTSSTSSIDVSLSHDLSASFSDESSSTQASKTQMKYVTQQTAQRVMLARLTKAQRGEEHAKAKAARATQREMAAELLLSELRGEVTKLSAAEKAATEAMTQLCAEKDALTAECGESNGMLDQLEMAIAEQQKDLNDAHSATAAATAAAAVAVASHATELTRVKDTHAAAMKAAAAAAVAAAARVKATAAAAVAAAVADAVATATKAAAMAAKGFERRFAQQLTEHTGERKAVEAAAAAVEAVADKTAKLAAAEYAAALTSMRARVCDSDAAAAAANARVNKLQEQQRALIAEQQSKRESKGAMTAASIDATASILAMVTRSPASMGKVNDDGNRQRASVANSEVAKTERRQVAFSKRLGAEMQKKAQRQCTRQRRAPKGVEDNADIVLFAAVGFILSMAYASVWIVNNSDAFGAMFGL
jgi:hypothetical protein